MFFSRKRDPEETELVMIALRTALYVRETERKDGFKAAQGALDRALKGMIDRSKLVPSDEQLRFLNIAAPGLAFDSTGFTDGLYSRMVTSNEQLKITSDDIQKALHIIGESVKRFVAVTGGG